MCGGGDMVKSAAACSFRLPFVCLSLPSLIKHRVLSFSSWGVGSSNLWFEPTFQSTVIQVAATNLNLLLRSTCLELCGSVCLFEGICLYACVCVCVCVYVCVRAHMCVCAYVLLRRQVSLFRSARTC